MTHIELCVEDLPSVAIATDQGVDGVELCARLDVGGLTPDIQLLEQSLTLAPPTGVHAMLRVRGGDFVHSRDEVDQMVSILNDHVNHFASYVSAGQLGFVVGVITDDGQINVEACKALKDAAGDAPLTFHRAFDETRNYEESLDTLMSLGFARVLTTGGRDATAHAPVLKHLASRAGNDLTIVASGGLRSHNVVAFLKVAHVRAVHMRAPLLGGGTDQDEVARIVTAVRNAS